MKILVTRSISGKGKTVEHELFNGEAASHLAALYVGCSHVEMIFDGSTVECVGQCASLRTIATFPDEGYVALDLKDLLLLEGIKTTSREVKA